MTIDGGGSRGAASHTNLTIGPNCNEAPGPRPRTIRASWTPAEAVEVDTMTTIHACDSDCTLNEFEIWATDAFGLVAAKETLSTIAVYTGADSTLMVNSEIEWTTALRAAMTRTGGTDSVLVDIMTRVEDAAKGSGDRNVPHFGQMTFQQISTEGDERVSAYRLSYDMPLQESSIMVQNALARTVNNMLATRGPSTRATAADPNYEAPNPFDNDADEFNGERPIAYNTVQSWLTTPKPDFEDLAFAVSQLRDILPPGVAIIDGLPDRRSEDPTRPGHARPGDRHKPHQVCGLFCSIWMEAIVRRFVKADGCGTGKTHAYISHLLGASLFWEHRGKPARKPTLVVCSQTVFHKTYQELYDQLGSEWLVYKYGKKIGHYPVLFDGKHSVYSSTKAGKTVIVCTFTPLHPLSTSDHFQKQRQGLFVRILIDEAHTLCRCGKTKQGTILKSFKAQRLFTGSPVVNSLQDIGGYLELLELPGWSMNTDYNVFDCPTEERSRYEKQYNTAWPSGKRDGNLYEDDMIIEDDSDSDCDSVLGLSVERIQYKIDNGWFCSQWPAGIQYNRATLR